MRRAILPLLTMLAVLTFLLAPAEPAAAQLEGVINPPVNPVYAAWQPFEGGVMMWWSDTDQIWVFYNNVTNSSGQRVVRVYDDIYTGNSYDGSDLSPWPITPPENRFIPIRGFGAIWRAIGGSNSPLGWSYTNISVGYDSAARIQVGGETFIQGPGATVYAATIASGSSEGSWRLINIG